MNILMICEFYNETLEYQENLLVKYYRKHGHAVTVITSTLENVFDYYSDRHDKNAPARTYDDQGATIVKLPYRYNILYRLRAYPRIDRILEEVRPDLIYLHDIMLNIPECVRYVKRHPECRMIMDYHADYYNSGKNWLSLKVLHGTIRKWFLDLARPYLARIYPIVPESTRFLHEVYGVPHSEMELLPLAADTDLVMETRGRNARAETRAKLQIPDDRFVIFTGGKLTRLKMTEAIIEAVARLDGHPVDLMVIGDTSPEDADYKRELIAAANGRANIHFVGWQDKTGVYSHLSAADIAVFPAGQSVLWQQAIGSGLPLVVGNSGAQDITYLNLYDNLVLLERPDIRPEVIAGQIAELMVDPHRLARMREGALKVADELLNADRLVARTLGTPVG